MELEMNHSRRRGDVVAAKQALWSRGPRDRARAGSSPGREFDTERWRAEAFVSSCAFLYFRATALGKNGIDCRRRRSGVKCGRKR